MNSTMTGRELDREVAEKIMGLCVVETLQLYGDGCVVSDSCMDDWLKHPEYGRISDPDVLPYYSTDIAAAWEVVQKMLERFGYANIKWDSENIGEELWYVSFDAVEVVAAETAPEAICKAALAAIEKEEKGNG